jgi:PAS domain S-box-containing protein
MKRKKSQSKTASDLSELTKDQLRHQLVLANRKMFRLERACKKTKTGQKESRELQARFTALTSSTNDAMIMIDDDGVTSFWNRAAEDIFGYSSREILGRRVADFIVPPQFYDRHVQGLARFKKTGKGKNFGRTLELSALRKNGEEFPMEISYYSSPIQLNGRWHAVAIIRDITARKRIELEVNRVKTELENEHQEAEEIGRSLLGSEPFDGRWTATVNTEPCSKAGGDRAGFVARALPDRDGIEEWLAVFDASGHGKGAAKFQEVAIGGLIALIGMGMSMMDALKAVNRTLQKLGTGRFLVGSVFRIMRDDERSAEDGFRWIEEFNLAQHQVLVLSPDDAAAGEWQWDRGDASGVSLPIGLFDGGLANLKPSYRKIRIGSRIIAFTDGVTEAVNPKAGQFSQERVQDLLLRTRNLSLRQSYHDIVRAVKCWVGDLPDTTPDEQLESVQMSDDITLAVVDIA